MPRVKWARSRWAKVAAGVVLCCAAITGITLYLQLREEVTVVEGNLGNYRLITRKQALRKPLIDLQFYGEPLLTWPKPDEEVTKYLSYFEDASATALIVPELLDSYSPTPDYTFEIGGVPVFVSGDAAPIPYVYGNQRIDIRLKTAHYLNGASQATISIPPNRHPIPKLNAASVKMGRYEVYLRFLEPYVTSLPYRLEIDVRGGEMGQDFAVEVMTGNYQGLPRALSNKVRCSSGQPGIVMIPQGTAGVILALEVLTKQGIQVTLSRPSSGETVITNSAGDEIYRYHSVHYAAVKNLSSNAGVYYELDSGLTGLPRISQWYDVRRDKADALSKGVHGATKFRRTEYYMKNVDIEMPPASTRFINP